MKFTDDFIPSLFIPLLGLGANNSHVSQRGDLAVPSHVLATGPSPTVGAQAVFTHHGHHHHDNSRYENRHENVGNAEDGVRRPRVGQKSTHVDTKSELQEANTCPTPPVLSCSAQATETDTCCVVNPGGVLVHTQFWDLDVGEADSWGIHGLWPDKCNGQYYENCDSGRAYSGEQITQTLQSAGQSSLLDFMNSNWLSNDESPSDFWAHEWKTHGTCVSTLEPQCFSGYSTAQEVVPYFETVVALFQKFDTYKALTDAGITPSSSATYNLADLQDAVSKSLGYVPDFVCSRGKLSSVQYYLNAQGPLQDGNFVASHASRKSDCPKTGIQWPPKTVDSST